MTAERTTRRSDPGGSAQGRATSGRCGDDTRVRRTHRTAIYSVLRQAYAEVLNEPVPDSFRRLFGDLAEEHRGKRH